MVSFRRACEVLTAGLEKSWDAEDQTHVLCKSRALSTTETLAKPRTLVKHGVHLVALQGMQMGLEDIVLAEGTKALDSRERKPQLPAMAKA